MNPPGSVRDGDTSISLSSRLWFDVKSRHVREARDIGESGCEDFAPPRIDFALEDDCSSGSFDAEIEASDAREEGPDIQRPDSTR